MPATAEPGPEDGQADARVTPGDLLHHDGHQDPRRVTERVGHEVEGVEADPGGLLDDRPRRLLALVPLVGGGADHARGEVVHPLLDLQLLVVKGEREQGVALTRDRGRRLRDAWRWGGVGRDRHWGAGQIGRLDGSDGHDGPLVEAGTVTPSLG